MRWLGDAFYTASWHLPGRRWRRLLAFAEAEAESALELRCAASLTPEPERAALYLRHAADEARHAQILRRWAEVARSAPVQLPRRGHGQLFQRLGEASFVAFVHLGERRGRRQFEAHQRFFERRDPALATAIGSILEDERRHEAYTGELVSVGLGGELGPKAMRRARWFDRVLRWRRAGAALTTPLFALTMGVLYLLCAPLAWAARRRRPTGWRTGD